MDSHFGVDLSSLSIPTPSNQAEIKAALNEAYCGDSVFKHEDSPTSTTIDSASILPFGYMIEQNVDGPITSTNVKYIDGLPFSM